MSKRAVAALFLAVPFVLLSVLVHSKVAEKYRRFPPDAVNYMAVANNIAAGRGIVGPRPDTEGNLLPFVSQPPLYPILTAALIRAGLDSERAALAIPAASHWAAVFLVALALLLEGGPLAAALGALVFSLFMPLYEVSVMALTEPLFILLCLAVVVLADLSCREPRRPPPADALHAALGLLAGLAFMTRYIGVVFAPFLFLVHLWRYMAMGNRGRVVREAAVTFGFYGALVLLVFLRYYVVSHPYAGRAMPTSQSAFWFNLRTGLAALRRDLLPLAAGSPLGWLQGAAILAASPLVALRSLKDRGVFRRLLPGAFCLIYLLVLCYLRSQVQFDPVGTRFLAPLYAVFLFWMASCLAALIARPEAGAKGLLRAGAVVVAVSFSAAHLSALASVASRPPAPEWPGREAAEWLGQRTAEAEVIVSSRPDLLLRPLPERRYVQLWFRPEHFEDELLREGDLESIAGLYGARYLVLFKLPVDTSRLGPMRYGDYVGRLLEEKGSPEARLVKETEDALVFELVGRGAD